MQQIIDIGLACICQDSFSGDKEKIQKESHEVLEEMGRELNFRVKAYPDLIKTEAEAARARSYFAEEQIDFLLVQNTTFAPGFLIEELAEGDYYIGLWGLKETVDRGEMPLNSFCGSNMNASALDKKFGEEFPFKWFYGNTRGRLFLPRFKTTLAALRGIKSLQKMKVGLVVGTAPGFGNLQFEKNKLQQNLGVDVELIPELDSIIKNADDFAEQEIQKNIEEIKDNTEKLEVSEEHLNKTIRYQKAMTQLVKERQFDCLALRCWPDTNQQYGIFPCSAIAKLNESGIAASCEGDVYGAIALKMLQGMAGNVSLLLDLSDLDFTEDMALLWHCGNLPATYARDVVEERAQFNNPEFGTAAEGLIKPMRATVINLLDNGQRFFTFEGRFLDHENISFRGGRGWFTDFHHPADGVFKLEDLVNSIFANRLSHHYAVVPGSYSEALEELAGWMNLNSMPVARYSNLLQ